MIEVSVVGTLIGMFLGYVSCAVLVPVFVHRTMQHYCWTMCEHDLPKYPDELLLVKCSGNYKGIHFMEVVELATYTDEGWIIEQYPEWEDAEVVSWRRIEPGFNDSRSLWDIFADMYLFKLSRVRWLELVYYLALIVLSVVIVWHSFSSGILKEFF